MKNIHEEEHINILFIRRIFSHFHFHLNVILFFFFFFYEKNFKQKYSKISLSLSFLLFLSFNNAIFFLGGKNLAATRNGRNNDASMQTIAQGERNLETAVRTRVAINSPVFARLLCEIIGCYMIVTPLGTSLAGGIHRYTMYTLCTRVHTCYKGGKGSLIPTPESCNPTIPTILVNGTLIYHFFPPPSLPISVDNVYRRR